MSIANQPGYRAFLPGSYQVVGPGDVPDLDKILCTGPAGATVNQPPIDFVVKTPNVRCRTRVAITLEPQGASAVDVDTQPYTTFADNGPATLWVAAKTISRGARRKSIPTRNVVGTGAAPLSIPTDARLWGYEFEIETAGEELHGRFVPPTTVGAPAEGYTWRVQARYESVVRLSDQEWNQFLGRFGVWISPEGTELT
jgi:hypothetical protein